MGSLKAYIVTFRLIIATIWIEIDMTDAVFDAKATFNECRCIRMYDINIFGIGWIQSDNFFRSLREEINS